MPQFDLVSLGIDDPGDLSILRFVDPVDEFASFFLENFDDTVKVFDTVVDHKGCLAWSEVVAFRRTDRPDSGPSGYGTTQEMPPNAEPSSM